MCSKEVCLEIMGILKFFLWQTFKWQLPHLCVGSGILTTDSGKGDSSESGEWMASTCFIALRFISFFHAEIYISDQPSDTELESCVLFLVTTYYYCVLYTYTQDGVTII